MRAARNGDAAAYALLLSEILPMLRQLVVREWPSAPNVEAVVQEILVSVHSVRDLYDPGRAFTPWLTSIATNRISDAVRHAREKKRH